MARNMLNDSKLNDIFWVQEVHTTIHILNKGSLRNNNDQTPFGLWKGRLENAKHFKVSGSMCYIKREDTKLKNLTPRWMKAYLLGTHGIEKHTDVTTLDSIR